MDNFVRQKKIGYKLKELREGSNITQETLAEKINYSVNTISRIENGQIPMSEKFKMSICRYFNIEETYFFICKKTNSSKEQLLLDEINNELSELDYSNLKSIQSIIRTIKATWII